MFPLFSFIKRFVAAGITTVFYIHSTFYSFKWVGETDNTIPMYTVLHSFIQSQKNPCFMATLPPGKSTIKRHAKIHRFLDGVETFQMVWKLSRWSVNFPDGLEKFQKI